MRNPVGPLPSSIYWRRRAVAASLIALLAVLIAWAVTSGGGNGGSGDAKADGPDPANSITPGPSGSGPAISQQPGGRDESGEDAGSDAGNGDTEPGGTGGTDATGSPGATPSGTGGASGADGATGQQVPAGSPLPDCKPTALRLSLKTEVSYGPDDKPVFRLIAKNTSAATCKADLGPKNAVLTITEAGGEDDRIWSSEDCPAASGHLFLKIPAGATVVHTVEWDRKKSSPQCASAPTTEAGPGTYLLEAKAPGVPLQRASFVLPKD
ncbi:hypothetical protein OG230_15765 [Streptomyces sp. NBC_00234]|uniref:hypothetical protein n=1 Tax=Streptomyces sp. NBC_00234 TaxID=2903638 RepID=UPI002E2B905E|nr:hypothetical protein [Streptomyces sp. NBC_00234]